MLLYLRLDSRERPPSPPLKAMNMPNMIRYKSNIAGIEASINFRMIATMRPKGMRMSVIVVFWSAIFLLYLFERCRLKISEQQFADEFSRQFCATSENLSLFFTKRTLVNQFFSPKIYLITISLTRASSNKERVVQSRTACVTSRLMALSAGPLNATA